MTDLQIDIDYLLGRDMQFQKHSSALFLLKLKSEKYHKQLLMTLSMSVMMFTHIQCDTYTRVSEKNFQ